MSRAPLSLDVPIELPPRVAIREVGPRDGFQNEPELIPTARKLELIELLAASGLRRIELTSLVRPDLVPQLADAVELLELVRLPERVEASVLVPNRRGLERALAFRAKLHQVTGVVSASESHNCANLRHTIAETLAELELVLAEARGVGLRAGAVVSVSFGCPYEGRVEPQTVLAIAARLLAAGAQEIGFADTNGMANPLQVRSFFEAARGALGEGVELTAHFHNTRGLGLANVLAALEAGCDSFESSFGEIGGCPFSPGATGNLATEDLVSMLAEMGIETGVDLVRLLAAAAALRQTLGRPLGSHTLAAGPVSWSPGAGGSPGA